MKIEGRTFQCPDSFPGLGLRTIFNLAPITEKLIHLQGRLSVNGLSIHDQDRD